MFYIGIALVGLIFSSISSAADKFIVDKWFENSSSAAFTAAIPKMIIALAILFYLKPSLDLGFLLVGFTASILYYGSYIISFSVLKKRDVTKLQPLSALSNVFVVIISALVLGNLVSIQEYLGIFLITSGAFIALTVKVRGRIDLSRTTGFYLLGVLSVSLFSILSDQTVGSGQALVFYSVYDSFGAMILSPVLLKKDVRTEVRSFMSDKLKMGKMVFLKSFASASVILYFMALSRGPVEVVASIFTLSSVGVLGMVELMRKLDVEVEERTSREAYIKKIAAVILAVIGLLVLKITV